MALTNKILFVDDDEDFQQGLAQRMSTMSLLVDTASHGEEALEKMERTVYDVVILDVLMPGMDGIETLKRIKQVHPATEVILLTGQGSVETSLEGMRRGAFDYLVKPCDPESLKSRIQRAQEKKEIEQSSEQEP